MVCTAYWLQHNTKRCHRSRLEPGIKIPLTSYGESSKYTLRNSAEMSVHNIVILLHKMIKTYIAFQIPEISCDSRTTTTGSIDNPGL